MCVTVEWHMQLYPIQLLCCDASSPQLVSLYPAMSPTLASTQKVICRYKGPLTDTDMIKFYNCTQRTCIYN